MDACGHPDDAWSDPRSRYPEYPPGSVVELRVHGVGGEPPSGMTRDPHPVLVGGDLLAGFWRARDPVVGRLDGGQVPRGGTAPGTAPLHVREVLAWGGQTSGTWRHALWVVLLPFALFNTAGRMHAPGWRGVAHRAVTRVLALTITLTVVALTSSLALDPLARCGPSCLADDRIAGWSLRPFAAVGTEPAARLGLAALLPVLVVVALWAAGRYRAPSFEGAPETASDDQRRPAEPDHLAAAGFWDNRWPASRLRSFHATAGLAWVGATLGLSAVHVTGDARWWWPTGASLTVVLVAAVACARPAVAVPGWSRGFQVVQEVTRLLAVVALGLTAGAATSTVLAGRSSWVVWLTRAVGVGLLLLALRRATDRVLDRDARGAVGEALGTLAGAVAVGWWWLPATTLRGVADEALASSSHPLLTGLFTPAYTLVVPLLAVQVALLVVLAAVSIGGAAVTRTPRPDAGVLDEPGVRGGTGALAISLVALLLTVAVGVSLHSLLLDWLGDPTLDPATGGLVLPWWYALTAVVVAYLFPLVLLLIGGATVLRARRSRPDADEVAAHLGLDAPGEEDPREAERLRDVGVGWLVQRYLRRGGDALAAAALTATAIVGVVGAALLAGDVPPHRAFTTGWRGTLVGAAVWLVGFVAVGGVLLLRRSLRDRESRRGIGRLWDVITFWPRVTHPFAPPCYGEAVVPLLRRRVQDLTDRADLRVVVAGHSQGSVIAAAALARGVTQPTRTALVTYGSPLAILYERNYPVACGPPVWDAVAGNVSTWHHLFGLTEPFAVPFWSGPRRDGDAGVAAVADRAAGWPATSRTTLGWQEPCPVCGDGGATPGRVPDGSPTTIDQLVPDPWPWARPFDPCPPRVEGHSTYHRHGLVDRHLATIARHLAGATSGATSADRDGE